MMKIDIRWGARSSVYIYGVTIMNIFYPVIGNLIWTRSIHIKSMIFPIRGTIGHIVDVMDIVSNPIILETRPCNTGTFGKSICDRSCCGEFIIDHTPVTSIWVISTTFGRNNTFLTTAFYTKIWESDPWTTSESLSSRIRSAYSSTIGYIVWIVNIDILARIPHNGYWTRTNGTSRRVSRFWLNIQERISSTNICPSTSSHNDEITRLYDSENSRISKGFVSWRSWTSCNSIIATACGFLYVSKWMCDISSDSCCIIPDSIIYKIDISRIRCKSYICIWIKSIYNNFYWKRNSKGRIPNCTNLNRNLLYPDTCPNSTQS